MLSYFLGVPDFMIKFAFPKQLLQACYALLWALLTQLTAITFCVRIWLVCNTAIDCKRGVIMKGFLKFLLCGTILAGIAAIVWLLFEEQHGEEKYISMDDNGN